MASLPPAVETSLKTSGFFALRTALLPVNTLLDWVDGATVDTDATPEAVATARATLVIRLREIVRRPEVREALFLASPSTHDETTRWLDSGKPDARLERTLTRYVQRMAGRATPFGLFAGCSTAGVGSLTNLQVEALSSYKRNSRIDNEHLAALADAFGRDENVRSVARYMTNSSLYRLNERYRYVEARARGGVRTHKLIAIEGDEYLDAVVERAKNGATLDELVRIIRDLDPDGDITDEDARSYVIELVDRDVLSSDLAPVVTGGEPLEDIIAVLTGLRRADDAVMRLRDVRARLQAIDEQPLGTEIARYQDVAAALEPLGIKADASKLLQVDLLKPAPRAECGTAAVAAIIEGLKLLQRISPPTAMLESLRRFREAFTTRYERQELPLLEVLDEESGIGFERPSGDAAPLIDGLPLGGPEGSGTPWSSREAYLLNRLAGMFKDGAYIFELQPRDIEALSTGTPLPLPDALCVVASVAGAGRGSERDVTVSIRHASGPSGGNILGRFCRMDQALHRHVIAHLAAEEAARPGVIFAEIVHLPAGRLANILGRPVLRAYEIPYLGRSGAPPDRQIPVSDLLVSIRDDRIVLRSARLGVEVVPRMTTMHNFSRGQAIYRFLCSLQYQGLASWLSWSWGSLETSPFLPRVVHGRTVLSRAKWRIGKFTIAEWSTGSLQQQRAAIERWRTRWTVPRHVALVDADNELPVDFHNVLSVETLVHLLKKRDHAVITEMYPQPPECAAYGPEGQFAHEIVVPLLRDRVTETVSPARRLQPSAVNARRSYPPGSEWLYVKLYTGTSTVDRLLINVLGPVIRDLEAAGAFKRWFFLRFSDPEWHLRLRFNGEPEVLQSTVFPTLRNALEASLRGSAMWKVQLDTYQREIERYGGHAGMELTEDLFHADSVSSLEILAAAPGDEGIDARWRLCLRSWDLMLDDFGFSLAEKHQIAVNGRRNYGREFRVGKDATHVLGGRFRRERSALERLLNPAQEGTDPMAASFASLRRRSARIRPLTATLRLEHERGGLTTPLSAIATSHLHLNAFRLIRSAQRQHELVLYDYLERLYESQLARARRAGAAAPVAAPVSSDAVEPSVLE